jgi:hypothetical protein
MEGAATSPVRVTTAGAAPAVPVITAAVSTATGATRDELGRMGEPPGSNYDVTPFTLTLSSHFRN